MVRLRLTAQVIPERVFASEETPSKPKQFREVVADPETVTLGWLVNKLKYRYQTTFRQQLGDIKYVKDGDDVDIDLEMSPFDAFMNEGLARRDGSDQDAVIKLITEGGLRLREGSVVPDLTPARFKFNPPPLPPTWTQSQQPASTVPQISSFSDVPEVRSGYPIGSIPEADQPIRSLERDSGSSSVRKRKRYPQGSPIIIQDSQADAEHPDDAQIHLDDESTDNEPKSESPEPGMESRNLFPVTSTVDLPATRASAQGSIENAQHSISHNGKNADHGFHVASSARSTRESKQRRAGNKSRSPLRSISLGDSDGVRGEFNEFSRHNIPITPPSDNPRNARSKSISSNGKLSRPSCKIPSTEASSTRKPPFPPRKGGNVYDVPESDIEDSQLSPAPPSNKRKFSPELGSSINEGRQFKRPHTQSSPSHSRIRASEINGILVDRHTRVLDGPRVPPDRRPVHDFTDPDKLPDDYQSAESEPASAQDEVDQQILNDSITLSNGDQGANKPETSMSDAETESAPSESGTSENESPHVSESAPTFAGESQTNVNGGDDTDAGESTEAVSEKENIEPAAHGNADSINDTHGLAVGHTSTTNDYERSLQNGNSARQTLKEVAIPATQSSNARAANSLKILNGIRRDNVKKTKTSVDRDESQSYTALEESQGQLHELSLEEQTSNTISNPVRQVSLASQASEDSEKSKPAKRKRNKAKNQAASARPNSDTGGLKSRDSRTSQSAEGTRPTQRSSRKLSKAAHASPLDESRPGLRAASKSGQEMHSDSSESSQEPRRMGLGITTSPSHRRTSSIVLSSSPLRESRKPLAKLFKEKASKKVRNSGAEKDVITSREATSATTGSSSAESVVKEKPAPTEHPKQSSEPRASLGPIVPPSYSLEQWNQEIANYDATKAQAAKMTKNPSNPKLSKKGTKVENVESAVRNDRVSRTRNITTQKKTKSRTAAAKTEGGLGEENSASKQAETEAGNAKGRPVEGPKPTATPKEANTSEVSKSASVEKSQQQNTIQELSAAPATVQKSGKETPRPGNVKATAVSENRNTKAGSLTSVAKAPPAKSVNTPYKPPKFTNSSLPKQSNQRPTTPPKEKLSGLTKLLRQQEEAAARKAAEQEKLQSQRKGRPSTTFSSSEEDDDSDETESSRQSDSDGNKPSTTAKKTPIASKANVSPSVKVPAPGQGVKAAAKATSSQPQEKDANIDRTAITDPSRNDSADDTDTVNKDKTSPPAAKVPQKSSYKLRFWG